MFLFGKKIIENKPNDNKQEGTKEGKEIKLDNNNDDNLNNNNITKNNTSNNNSPNTTPNSERRNSIFGIFSSPKVSPRVQRLKNSETSVTEQVLDDEKIFEDDEKLNSMKNNWILSMKKGIVETVASTTMTSSVGKILFTEFLDKEAMSLMDKAIDIITKYDNKEIAKQMHKDTIKIAAKVLLLYEQRKVNSNFKTNWKLGFLFRRICSAIKNAYNNRRFDENFVERLGNMMRELQEGIISIIKPLVSQRTINSLNDVVSYLSNPKFLLTIVEYSEFKNVVVSLAWFLEEYKK